MVLEYFNLKKHKHSKSDTTVQPPVLDDEDELFLQRITSEGTPPSLPERPVVILDNGAKIPGKDAQTVLMDGAEKVALPTTPHTHSEGKGLVVDGEQATNKGKGAEGVEEKHSRKFMSYLPAIPGRLGKDKANDRAAADLHALAESSKPGSTTQEEEKEKEDLTAILDQLNLSAVNNRVFSFSKESQELLDKFKLVLKDIVNGVPTAYDDLEKLLTGSETQLKKMYGALPPFLQALVKSLPAKMTATLAPEFLAASSEKPGFDAKAASGSKAKFSRPKIPSLKSLVAQQGAVATMLKSILNFLKLRFPAFVTGTNVLMSLAVFLLLFVFWYCHKRGRETRIERERSSTGLDAEGEVSADDRSISSLEDSIILADKSGEASESAQPPLIIHPDDGVADMPSVLDLPEPASVPLPKTPLREMEEPLEK